MTTKLAALLRRPAGLSTTASAALRLARMPVRRTMQTALKPGDKITVYDSMCHVYEDAGYKLDVKPWCTRDGRWKEYIELGATVVSLPAVYVCALAVFSLVWYTMFDSDVSVLRSSAHPFFEANTGGALRYQNPALHWQLSMPFSCNVHDERNVFSAAIDNAVQRRRAMDAARRAEQKPASA